MDALHVSHVGAPSDSGIDAKVTIEVTKNGKTVTGQVYSKEFWNICRMLVLMQAHNIPLKVENALLTPDGFMNLCGVDLSYKDLQGEDLSEMDASGANCTGQSFVEQNWIVYFYVMQLSVAQTYPVQL
ncbi:effector protein PipB [Salmonella enterica subsp. arizonae]|uniref:Effector protein PipB n=1 Tax=Salmonella enterica subsp. arizonae TaxID=59203 RepID=A0A379SJZ1_SALER|nr:effector protein PipB [Salmonella enterica subsp. arizonae]